MAAHEGSRLFVRSVQRSQGRGALTGQGQGMESDRWKKASLAIDAVIRGLEQDQIAFQYDETACPDVTGSAAAHGFAAGQASAELAAASSPLLRGRSVAFSGKSAAA
jgi:hypothetical protein